MPPSSFLLTRTSPKSGRETFYFNRRAPTKLVHLLGVTLWRETLSTTDPKEAERLARQRAADTDEMIASARQEHSRRRSLVARLTKEERDRIEETGGLSAFRETTNGKRQALRFVVGAADLLSTVAEDISAAPWSISEHDSVVQQAQEAQATAGNLRAVVERDSAILSRAGAKPQASDAVDPAPVATADLHTVVDRWASETGAPKQHAEQYRYPVDRFYQLHGPVALKAITKAHLREFKDALAKLPRSTRRDIRDATILRAIAIADKEGLPRIEAPTVAKHLAAIGTLLRHALSWGYIEINPADGFKLPQKRQKIAGRKSRVAFTTEQMRRLEASLLAEYKITDDDYWIPFVAAYQGTRIEECCQLLKSDIYQDAKSGVWVMKITDAGDGQKIKNVSSLRTVPLHPALIERGFLDHLERSPGPRVFSTLQPDQRGRFAGPYGKRFGRHLRKRAKIVDRNLTFHSLRHRWITCAANADLSERVQHYIDGHAHGTAVERGYTGDLTPEMLLESLARVDPFA